MTMKYAAKKIVWMLLTMVIVSFLAFLAFRIIPGDPTAKLLGEQATPERVEALRQEGLLSVPAGPETVRLLPPLNVSEEEIQQALAIIRRVLKTYAK